MYYLSIKTLERHGAPTSFARLWDDGDKLGGFTGYNISQMSVSLTSNLLVEVLFANMFQLIISLVYLFYNGILTRQLLADEMFHFLDEKKALRVSFPRTTIHRSGYMLSLPFRYAIPLMVACVLLHWFVSRSIFVLTTRAYSPGPDGVWMPGDDSVRLAFSVSAQLSATLLGVLMVVALLLNSLRRYPKAPVGLARIASDSSGINAVCHRPAGDTSAFLYPCMLTIVQDTSDSDAAGRLSFSTDREGRKPEDGEVYWLPVLSAAPGSSR